MAEMPREKQPRTPLDDTADVADGGAGVIDVLQALVESCAGILDCDAGGLMLAGGDEDLLAVTFTTEETRPLDILQLATGEGPCIDCFSTGEPVTVAGAEELRGRWPRFGDAAAVSGFRSVHATPLRVDEKVLGVMGLFSFTDQKLDERDIATARALADIATIAILRGSRARESAAIARQLEDALDSRVLIERAKGVLVEVCRIPLGEAFTQLEAYAIRHGSSVRTVAEAITTRALDARMILGEAEARGHR